MADGWEGLRMLREKHHTAIFSGPEALKMYLTVRPIENLEHAVRTIAKYHPAVEGRTMTELKELAASVGLQLSMWRASAIAELPVPSVVHLRSQHFSAIVERKGEMYRLRDPGLGGDLWLSADALRDESTGLVLAAAKPSGDEWTAASEVEGRYPNDQTSTYTYSDEANDHRLQTIHHKYPNASTLSKFDYTYDAVGNILTWRQQADSTAVVWRYGYDPADHEIPAAFSDEFGGLIRPPSELTASSATPTAEAVIFSEVIGNVVGLMARLPDGPLTAPAGRSAESSPVCCGGKCESRPDRW